jgi:hypothetical protein
MPRAGCDFGGTFIVVALSLVLLIAPIVAKEILLLREQIPLLIDRICRADALAGTTVWHQGVIPDMGRPRRGLKYPNATTKKCWLLIVISSSVAVWHWLLLAMRC